MAQRGDADATDATMAGPDAQADASGGSTGQPPYVEGTKQPASGGLMPMPDAGQNSAQTSPKQPQHSA